MKCPHCGVDLPAAASFCTVCGTKIQQAAGVGAPGVPGAAGSVQDPGVTPVSMPGTPDPVSAAAAASVAPAVPTSIPAPAPGTADAAAGRTMVSPAGVAAGVAGGAGVAAGSAAAAVILTEKERRAQLKAQLKQARQAYRDARRAAGVSSLPKVVAAAVLAGVLLGGGATATWAYMNQQQRSQVSDLQKQVDDLKGQVKAAKQEAAKAQESAAGTGDSSGSGDSSASGGAAVAGGDAADADYSSYKSYVGLWTGDLTDTTTGTVKNVYGKDYGAKDHPIKIDITSIDDTGRMKADVSVLFHGHTTDPLDGNDADTVNGDAYLTFKDVTSTFDPEKGFSFTLKPEGQKNKIEVTAKPKDDGASAQEFEVTAMSYYESQYQSVTDTYTISKQ